MEGIKKYIKENVNKIVDELFDRMAFSLLGNIPHLKNKKILVISSKPHLGIGHLFMRALGKNDLNELEEAALKHLLDTAYYYIDTLKRQTKEKITTGLYQKIEEAQKENKKPTQKDINLYIIDELKRAGNHMALIAAAESNNAKNVGTAIKISHIASELNDDNPNVAFIVVRDNKTCEECKRLHLLDDKVTPKVWKLSEIGYGYHKKGENNPKIGGLHPHCRCALTFIPKNFGFKDGKLTFIDNGHDEYKKQRGLK